MSLSIQSFSAVALVRTCTPEEHLRELDALGSNDVDDDVVYLAPNSDFSSVADGMVAGYYRTVGRPTADCPDVEFRASYYSRWREHVAYALSGRPLEDLESSGVERHPLSSLLLFSDQEGLIGPRTSAQIRSALEAARLRLRDHAARLDELRKDPSAVDALVDYLWPVPDELTVRRFMVELPGSPEQKKDLAYRYFTRRRELGRSTLEDSSWPGVWLGSCAKVEEVFAAPGPSGCVAFA